MGNREPRVDDYIAGLPEWQQQLFGELRDLIHEADPDIAEAIKRTRQPYFVLDGNVCAFLAAKDHANLFLYDGAIVPEAIGVNPSRTIGALAERCAAIIRSEAR